MKYVDVMKYCLAKPGTTRVALNNAGTAFGFSANGAFFGYFQTGAPIQWRLTLEVTEENYEKLLFPPKVLPADDKPKGKWLTIVRVESFDEELLLELIDWSYQSNVPSEALNESVG
ncbi:putative DNA-binding protein (MmcQ/YjbR family) [Alteromonadaceae bacterium 2753L.S.0a.02]|nr:putative DNA-binding protein (MmcQ/YjbR family) [Alteromonadaceae bacterium 2753L.S.0a.02]